MARFYLSTLRLTPVDVVRTVNDVWKVLDRAGRNVFRPVLMEVLGHAPDPEYTYDEIIGSMLAVQPPKERGTCMCLACAKHGEVCLPVKGGGMTDVERNRVLRAVLRGGAVRKDVKRLRDSMVFQSTTLEQRTRLGVKLAIKWLRGRRDLLKYTPTLVGVAGMGAGVFCTYVAALTSGAHPELHDLLLQKKAYMCCIKCALESQKEFKIRVRFGAYDKPEKNGEIFDWQYSTHMLGRFDHEAFADKEDLLERTDYDGTLPVKNGVSYLKQRFDELYERALMDEGERFGIICAQARSTSGQPFHHLTEMALTSVPTGSMPSSGINKAALSEIDKQMLNKKLAIIYFTKGEEEAIKFGQRHARSNWMWKLEIAKLRNLVPGTLGYFLSSARVSVYGEARFLGTMENVPLMWSEARINEDNVRFAGYQDYGYVACRDYKNYNVCHKHERMQMFYRAAAAACRRAKEYEMATEFDNCAKCLDDVGVYVDGEYHKWEYGLQSGWAHTMLFHCTHNSCAGKVVAQLVEELTGWRRYIARHQGDDSQEVWSDPIAAPLAQAILDAGGQVGQATKQHFANEKGSWAEFLRVWSGNGVHRGSALRIIGGFVSNDSQHSPTQGGVETIRTIVSIANTVWRRLGGVLKWRESDMGALLQYWCVTNAGYRNSEPVDWRALLSERGGLLIAAHPSMQWRVIGGRYVRTMRHRVEVGPTLLKRARRNLNAMARIPDPGRYAGEYAQDMLACAVEHGVDMTNVKVAPTVPCGQAELELEMAKEVAYSSRVIVRRCIQGEHGWEDSDSFCEQVAINYLYAGSESAARKHIASGEPIFLGARGKLRSKVLRGIDLLAGRTSKDVALKTQNFACAEKYWSHIEVALRKVGSLIRVQRWLGLQVALEALKTGDWI